MAFYKYQCKACNCVFEKRLSMDDRKKPESEPCPECGKLEVLQYIEVNQSTIHSGEGLPNSSLKLSPEFKQVMSTIKKAKYFSPDLD